MARLRNKHCSRLHALLIGLEARGIGTKISVANASGLLDRIGVTDEAARYRILVAREVVDDIARLDQTLRASKKRVAVAVTASGTSVTDIVGVGPIGAATIIGYTKDITRFPTKGHYATYNATAPIEVSSAGNTRHRPNLRGNRTPPNNADAPSNAASTPNASRAKSKSQKTAATTPTHAEDKHAGNTGSTNGNPRATTDPPPKPETTAISRITYDPPSNTNHSSPSNQRTYAPGSTPSSPKATHQPPSLNSTRWSQQHSTKL
jgi:hypothetical protein